MKSGTLIRVGRAEKVRGANVSTDLLGFYAGPDQMMGVTSGIAGAVGILLVFWNKLVGVFVRVANRIRGSAAEPPPVSSEET